MKLLLLIPMLIFAGCATQPAQMQTRYVLDNAGNLQQQQYFTPDNSDKYWKTVVIVGASVLGVAGIVWLIDEWKEPDEVTVQTQDNPLIAKGGSSMTEWTTDFVAPVYQTVN